MPSVLLLTQAAPWRKARSVNYATNGFRTLVPTATRPVGVGATDAGLSAIDIENLGVGAAVQNTVFFKPYAIGADDVTFSIRAWIWTPIPPVPVGVEAQPTLTLYDPTLLCELSCIASTVLGVAGGLVGSNERFADTMTITTGNSGLSLEVLSNTSNLAGWARLDISGPFLLDFDFSTGGSATSANALWRMY